MFGHFKMKVHFSEHLLQLYLLYLTKEMYLIAQEELKLDGVITEFSDVFSPISLLLRYHRLEINQQVLWHHTDKKIEENEEE